MKRYLIIGLIPFFALAQADVDVIFERHATTKIELHDGARLADLLFNLQLPKDVYWRTAQIANEKTITAFQATKEQLLKDLKALQVFWMREGDKGSLIQSTQQLLQELDNIPVSGRLSIALDPAKSRIDPHSNPLLKGQYTLFLASRPDYIYFVGLIGASLASYWQDYRLLAGAAQHEAFLIQPDGSISRVPVANWNKLHHEPMAGATLFVGFDSKILPEQYKDINIRIANLITNRVPE